MSERDWAAFACKSDVFSASLTLSCLAAQTPLGVLRKWAGGLGGLRTPQGTWELGGQHLFSGTAVSVFPGCTPPLCSLDHLVSLLLDPEMQPCQPPAVMPGEAPSQGGHRPQQCFPARPWLHGTWKGARLRLARAPVLTLKGHNPALLITLESKEAASDLIPAARALVTGEGAWSAEGGETVG